MIFWLLLDLLQVIAKIHRLATHNFQEVPPVIRARCHQGPHKDGEIKADDTVIDAWIYACEHALRMYIYL